MDLRFVQRAIDLVRARVSGNGMVQVDTRCAHNLCNEVTTVQRERAAAKSLANQAVLRCLRERGLQ